MVTETKKFIHNGCPFIVNNYYQTDDPEKRKNKFLRIIAEDFCRTMSNEFIQYKIVEKVKI